MEVQQLRYFVAVARTRHFTRAAAFVHVAQPSLSKQIQTLETELGTPLFNRARGNITLTPAGETLLPIAQRIIADLDDAHIQIQELVGLNRGRLRLGATPSVSTIIVPDVLRRFHDVHPGIHVTVEERGSRDLVPLLARGELDLALIILPLHRRDPALTTTPILREPLVVAAANDAPLRAKAIRVRDLKHHPLVMFRDGYDLRDTTLAACRRARIEPRIAVEGGEMDAVLRFVETGLGIAVVPTMVLQDRPRLRRIPFRPPDSHAPSDSHIDATSTPPPPPANFRPCSSATSPPRDDPEHSPPTSNSHPRHATAQPDTNTIGTRTSLRRTTATPPDRRHHCPPNQTALH